MNRSASETLRIRRLIDAVADEPEIAFYQIDVRNHQTVEVPVVNYIKEGMFFLPRQVMIAWAEMAVAQFPTVKGHLPVVHPIILQGMEEAANAPLFQIEKP